MNIGVSFKDLPNIQLSQLSLASRLCRLRFCELALCQLIPRVDTVVEEVDAEPELRSQQRIHSLTLEHVFIYQTNRHYEIKRELVDDINQHTDKNRECCVLEVCQLDVQGSEFYSPTDV